jgi:hypothetical protein
MWKDATSYYQGDKERIPTAWVRDFGDGVRIVVTNGHRMYRPEWVMHCFALGMDTVPLKIDRTAPLEAAQQEAIRLCRDMAARISEALS